MKKENIIWNTACSNKVQEEIEIYESYCYLRRKQKKQGSFYVYQEAIVDKDTLILYLQEQRAKDRADIDYLAIMMDIDLGEANEK